MRKVDNKKHKINVMDILVILLALVCLGSVIFRMAATAPAYDDKEYIVYFEIDDIKSSSYLFFEGHEGENVRMSVDDKVFMGSLGNEYSRGVAVFTYTEDKNNGEKTTHQAYYPESTNGGIYTDERCSIKGFIVMTGKGSGNGIFLDEETYLAPDQTVSIATEHIEASIRITDIVAK